jgi:hypothetical protein
VVTIGVVLLAVPTAFAVFAEIDGWSLWIRGPIGTAWLIVAVVAVVRQHVHDRGVDQLVDDWRRERIDEELFAGEELLTAYLRPPLCQPSVRQIG